MKAYSWLKNLIHPPEKFDDPKNWPRSKKNIVVFTIAYCAFVAPLASNIYMPAVLQVKTDLQTTSSFISATLSVYVLFMGIMPVFWASLCDYYGRRPIYLCSNVIFIFGSLFAALSRNAWVFFVMRAIQAFGSSSALSVGGGSLSDIFHSGERGSAFGLFYLGPLIAPMVGPFIGGVLSDRAGWRSTMWLLLGTSVISFMLVLFLLPETYRHRIDEVAPTPKGHSTDDVADKDEAVFRSHIHSTHSDPTLVASKTSLHDQDSSSVESSEPPHKNRAPSVASLRLSSYGAEGEPAVPSAMEFIVPNYVPPYLMHEDDDSTENEKEIGHSSSSSSNSSASPVPERHVAFPSTVDVIDEKKEFHTVDIKSTPLTTTASALNNSLKRKPFNPLRPLLILLQPTNALLVGFNALALAAQFCMNNTLPITFHDLYNLNETMIGLCFCAGGLGSALGSVLGGRYSDYVMRRWLIKQELKRQRDLLDREAAFRGTVAEVPKKLSKSEVLASVDISMRAPPEVRLQSVWLGVFALPFGLMLYGWSVNSGLHLAYPLLGIFLSGFGMMMVLTSATTALIDANSDGNMATSAVACNSFARGVMGAVGGFTALPLLDAMGNGWLYTFWAAMTLVGAAGLLLMVMRAPAWRRKAAEKALNNV
ncbi:hypothetical protein BG005_000917 [Podila minutissima]|nr:hypothetical protein BG005_000917 [Podila minutissima]